jgi:hypothetical protein
VCSSGSSYLAGHGWGTYRSIIGCSTRHGDRADVLGKQSGVSNTGESQRAPKGTTPLRLREAGRIGMQVRSPARQTAARIGLKPEVALHFDRDEPQ